jgi:hypothetical protein
MDRGSLSLDSGYGTHVEVVETFLMTWHLIYGVYLMIVNLYLEIHFIYLDLWVIWSHTCHLEGLLAYFLELVTHWSLRLMVWHLLLLERISMRRS